MRNMTEGSVTGHLLSFAVPTVLGNLLQLSYNAADSVVVGKYLGENALAAVSTVSPIMTIMVLGVSGISLGASVLMSRFFGAGKEALLKKELATTQVFGFFCSLLVFLAGAALASLVLRLIRVPEAAFGPALLYFRLILLGFPFTFQYNVLAAALRSIGNSVAPVVFLGLSALLNIGLDLGLVAWLQWGIPGAALATVLSQAASCAACAIYLHARVPLLRLEPGQLRIDRQLLGETLESGSLTALQQSAQPIGKVLIQSVINSQGVTAMGAFNAVCRVDDFACIPAQSIGAAIMTCTAQNRGAGRPERLRESIRRGLTIALCYFPLICGTTLLLRRPMMALLTPVGHSEMQQMGTAYLAVKAWCFILPCVLNAMQGYFRGLNRMRMVLLCTLIQISLRTVFVWLLVPRMGITGEAWACLIGWSVQLIFEYAYYFLRIREKERSLC